MKTLTYYGTFNEELLRSEIFDAFPAWREALEAGRITEDYGSSYDDWKLQLFVPDSADEILLGQVVAAHDPNVAFEIDWLSIKEARDTFMALPEWSTFTAEEASNAINDRVLNGWTKQEVDDWIVANVTTLATAKTALQLVAAELVNLREINKRFAEMLMFLRDVIIRRNSG